MPRLSEDARQERRARIAEAAVRSFARKGIAGTSMADIIKEAGLSAGSIYSHFDSKAQLMRFTASAMMETRGGALIKSFKETGEVPGPHAVLRHMVHEVLPTEFGQVLVSLFAEAATNPELLEVVRESLQKARAMVGAFLEGWAAEAAGQGRLADCTPEQASERAADAVLVCAHGIMLRRALQPTVDVDALVDDLLLGWP